MRQGVRHESSFEPVGSQESIDVNSRVVAASHRDMEAEIEAGRFREDLYYRLNVIPLYLAPLRERGDDVLILAEHFIAHFNKEKGSNISGFSDEAKRSMLSYAWPGNVRELQNLTERITTLKREGVAEISDLPSRMISDKERVLQSFQMDVS